MAPPSPRMTAAYTRHCTSAGSSRCDSCYINVDLVRRDEFVHCAGCEAGRAQEWPVRRQLGGKYSDHMMSVRAASFIFYALHTLQHSPAQSQLVGNGHPPGSRWACARPLDLRHCTASPAACCGADLLLPGVLALDGRLCQVNFSALATNIQQWQRSESLCIDGRIVCRNDAVAGSCSPCLASYGGRRRALHNDMSKCEDGWSMPDDSAYVTCTAVSHLMPLLVTCLPDRMCGVPPPQLHYTLWRLTPEGSVLQTSAAMATADVQATWARSRKPFLAGAALL